jgi:hypothetical protein
MALAHETTATTSNTAITTAVARPSTDSRRRKVDRLAPDSLEGEGFVI